MGRPRARGLRRSARRSALGGGRLHRGAQRRGRRSGAAGAAGGLVRGAPAPLAPWIGRGPLRAAPRDARPAARAARTRRLARGRGARRLARDGGLRERRARPRRLRRRGRAAHGLRPGRPHRGPVRARGTAGSGALVRPRDARPLAPGLAARPGARDHAARAVGQPDAMPRRSRRAGARGRLLRGVVLHHSRRSRAHRRGSGSRRGVDRRRHRCCRGAREEWGSWQRFGAHVLVSEGRHRVVARDADPGDERPHPRARRHRRGRRDRRRPGAADDRRCRRACSTIRTRSTAFVRAARADDLRRRRPRRVGARRVRRRTSIRWTTWPRRSSVPSSSRRTRRRSLWRWPRRSCPPILPFPRTPALRARERSGHARWRVIRRSGGPG